MKSADAPVSASEVSAYLGCPRKWAGRYVWRWPQGAKAGTAVGTELHAMAEAYCSRGEVPLTHIPVAEMFVDALPRMARPGAHWALETKERLDIGGVPFERTLDWYGPSDALPGAPPGLPAVLDYKTSIDPQRYGVLSYEQKITDVQTLIYSYGHNRDVLFRHLYLRKTAAVRMLEAAGDPRKEERAREASNKPHTRAADAVLPPAVVRVQLERVVLPAARELYAIRRKGPRDPLTLPANTSHCEAYGGCPHAGRECQLTPTEILQGHLGETNMSQFNLFKALPVNGPSAGTPAPAAPPPAAPVAPKFSFGAPKDSAPATPAPEATSAPTAPVPTPTTEEAHTPAAPAPTLPPAVEKATDAELGAALRVLLRELGL